MLDLPPPEVLRVGDITVVVPGPAYEHIYENMLGALEGLIQVAEEVEPPLLLVDLANTRHVGSAFAARRRSATLSSKRPEWTPFGNCSIRVTKQWHPSPATEMNEALIGGSCCVFESYDLFEKHLHICSRQRNWKRAESHAA